jgi:serine/threonine protein kinase
MELLPSETWTPLVSWEAPRPAWAAVTSKLKLLTTSGIVHGDLHPGNILINAAGDVRVVDFDWARTVDEEPARYPAFLNESLLWAPGVAYDEVILATHDTNLIDCMYEMVRSGQY